MCHCSADDVASDFTLRGVIVQSIHGDRCVTDCFFFTEAVLGVETSDSPQAGGWGGALYDAKIKAS